MYLIFSFKNIRFFYIFDFYGVFLFFNVTHCDRVLIFSSCALLAYDFFALGIFSVLDNFCQIAPLHSNEV